MHWQFHFLNINSTVVSPKALSLVHYSSHYSHILLFPKPSPLRRWHTAVSFLPSTHFSSSTDHLHNALDRISSWMTASLLTMNSSKTEFLFSGLSKQLAKINNSSLNTTHSVRNLGFIFDEHSPFLTRSHPSPNLAITIFISFAVSIHTSIPKQLPPSPLPLFTPTLTTATLSQPAQVPDHPAPTYPELSCTCCCQRSQKSSHVTPVLQSLHWLTTQPSYLHNLITVQPPRSTRSSSLVTVAHPSTSSSPQITDRCSQQSYLLLLVYHYPLTLSFQA